MIFGVYNSADGSLLDDEFLCVQAQHFRFSFLLLGLHSSCLLILVTTTITCAMLGSFSLRTFFPALSTESRIKYLSIMQYFSCSWFLLSLRMSSPSFQLMVISTTLYSLLSSIRLCRKFKANSHVLVASQWQLLNNEIFYTCNIYVARAITHHRFDRLISPS